MLEKGFLTSNREDTMDNKKSRAVIMWGGAVCFVIGIVTIMLVDFIIQKEEYENIGHIVGLGLMGVGAILMCVGLWKNVMAQNKSRRQRRRK